jgi:hypothetical protein
MARTAPKDVTFFTISDAGFVPGTIGLVDSLRLQGHGGPIVVLDCGMREDQRRLLGREVTLIPWDRSQATNPTLFKPFAHLTDPSGVVVIIDSDVIVTAPLDGIIDRAASGDICVFPDPEADRWFAEWQSVFDLPSSPRQQPYVNAGFVCLSVDHHPDLLRRWWELCRSIWHEPSLYEGAADGPTSQVDQDALNALLMTGVERERIHLLDPDLAPASGALAEGVKVLDDRTLACSYRGRRSLLLHVAGKAKPWRIRDWPYVLPTAYTRLLRRLLTGDDTVLRAIPSDLPPWLRRGRAGAAWLRIVTTVMVAAHRLAAIPSVRPLARRGVALVRRGPR